MKKILWIVGLTATGKTALALELAAQYHAELISADSRQVYTDMDIGTGKDIPKDFTHQTSSHLISHGKELSYYANNQTKIWLIDQVEPNEEWSVSHFSDAVHTLLPTLWEQNTLPIIVGGTGFYLNALLHPPLSLHTPPQEQLRQKLATFTVEQLQTEAKRVNPKRFEGMNRSDTFNPRRLVRVIEIGMDSIGKKAKQTEPGVNSTNSEANMLEVDNLFVGLSMPVTLLEERIRRRVLQRLENGVIDEVKTIVQAYGTAIPAFSATGYTEIVQYLERKITYEELVEQWCHREVDYAKRQIVWFKKQQNIHWFNAHNSAEKEILDKLVKTWYHNK